MPQNNRPDLVFFGNSKVICNEKGFIIIMNTNVNTITHICCQNVSQLDIDNFRHVPLREMLQIAIKSNFSYLYYTLLLLCLFTEGKYKRTNFHDVCNHLAMLRFYVRQNMLLKYMLKRTSNHQVKKINENILIISSKVKVKKLRETVLD